jgi:starch synthase (maltosyl-transferring)
LTGLEGNGPPPCSVIIEGVWPQVDCGRYPAKRELGDRFTVEADVFMEGHGSLDAHLRYRHLPDGDWQESAMRPLGNDRWTGSFSLEQLGRYAYYVEAFPNAFRTWREDFEKRLRSGQEPLSELLEGKRLLAAAIRVAQPADALLLERFIDRLERATSPQRAAADALDPQLAAVMDRLAERTSATRTPELQVVVDPVRARFAAWYELFPRSQGSDPGVSGTFKDVEARLPQIAQMGFDVLYLPPIHPIGVTNRKGRNNSLEAAADDPGSPYAIGGAEGGHTAVHPDLGTIADFGHLVAACRNHGMELALDFAVQASPDHPWAAHHPDWFYRRPDGSIKFAENPPKKYQDIYPLNFAAEDWRALWEELRAVLEFWVSHGVRTFRVDNPHTKPFPFWEWLITSLKDRYPDLVFLSEAFTRPKLMKSLAKLGFTQSYTYFTWRNFKQEIVEYFTELTTPPMADYYRGNLFANTPDILPKVLQEGGRPAFQLRAALAGTLSSLYGIYSGFELCEDGALPGQEVYRDSEMFELKKRDWEAPGNINDWLTRLNRARRENAALQEYSNLRFFESDSEHVLFYGKLTDNRENIVLVVVNLDPFAVHASRLRLPLHEMGIDRDETFEVADYLTDARHLWKGEWVDVTLDPQVNPAHVFVVNRWLHGERRFDYF